MVSLFVILYNYNLASIDHKLILKYKNKNKKSNKFYEVLIITTSLYKLLYKSDSNTIVNT